MRKYLPILIVPLFALSVLFVPISFENPIGLSCAYATAIVGHSGLDTDLQGCWDMNEDSDTQRQDATSNNNHLDDNGTVPAVAGKLGNAADFTPGNSEYLSITEAAQTGLDLTVDWTYAAWILADNNIDTMVVFNKGYVNGNRSEKITIERFSNQMTVTTSADCTNVSPSDPSMTDPYGSTFIHTVYTFDNSAGTGDFFHDSVDGGDFTGLNTSATCDTTLDFFVAARNNNGTADQFFEGALDVVAVWSRILTQDEIDTLYNSGTGIACAAAAATGKFIEIIFDTEWVDKHRESKKA